MVRAPEIVHGKTSLVHHDGDSIFAAIPRPFQAMRYHSLIADPTAVPTCLTVTAWCDDGTVMAVRHAERPTFGVQFHPESFATPDGRAILEAFLAIASAAPRVIVP